MDEVTLTEGLVFADNETRKAAIEFLRSEIDSCESGKEKRNTRLNKWRRAAQLTPAEESKDFPWPKASNLVLPVTLTDVHGMTAALKAAYDQKRPFLHVEALNKTYQPHAEALQRYLSILVESKFHTNLRELKNEMFYDATLAGVKFCLIAWDQDQYEYKTMDASGNVTAVSMIRHKGPKIIPIREEDFFTREYVTDLEDAPWIGIRHFLTFHELKRREDSGIYYNIDAIKGYAKKSEGDNAEADRARAGFDTSSGQDLYEIMECYVFWDAAGDGKLVDVKVWFERTSGTVIREEFNDLGVRNVAAGYYYRLPGELYGMGVGWICESAQDGIDALVNMAVNSTHISSLQGFITKTGSNMGAKLKLKPFFHLEADLPQEDFKEVTFPNTSAPNMAMAAQLQNLNDRAVGANNSLLGFPDTVAKSRTTASGYMFQAQQSSRVFNAVVNNMDEWFAKIAMLMVFQLIRNKDDVDTGLAGPEDEPLIRAILEMKLQDVHLNFAFSITATEVEQTEEARRQAILTLSQLYSMYGQKILGLAQGEIQLLMPIAQTDPRIGQKLQESIMQYLEFSNQFKVGTTQLMKQILDDFDIQDKGYLVYVKNIDMMLEAIYSMRDMQLGGIQDAMRQGGRQIQYQGGGSQGAGGPMGNAGASQGAPQPGGGDQGGGAEQSGGIVGQGQGGGGSGGNGQANGA